MRTQRGYVDSRCVVPNHYWTSLSLSITRRTKKTNARHGSVPANVPQEEKDKIPIAEFFGTHAARVKEIKLKWDPKNVFQAQTNILKMA